MFMKRFNRFTAAATLRRRDYYFPSVFVALGTRDVVEIGTRMNKHLCCNFLLFLNSCDLCSCILCFKAIDFPFVSIPVCSVFGINTLVQCSARFVKTLNKFLPVRRNKVGLSHIKMLSYCSK